MDTQLGRLRTSQRGLEDQKCRQRRQFERLQRRRRHIPQQVKYERQRLGESRKCIAAMGREIKGLVRMRAGVEREKGAWVEDLGLLRRQLGDLGQ